MANLLTRDDEDINWDAVKSALDDPYEIGEAFTWSVSHEGYALWSGYYHQELNEVDVKKAKDLLRAAIFEHEGGSFEVSEAELEELL